MHFIGILLGSAAKFTNAEICRFRIRPLFIFRLGLLLFLASYIYIISFKSILVPKFTSLLGQVLESKNYNDLNKN